MFNEAAVGGAVVFAVGSAAWRVASRYSALPCPAWMAGIIKIENPLFPWVHAKAISERSHVQLAQNVLDAGCGPGRLTKVLACHAGSVTAFDAQLKMLELAKKNIDPKWQYKFTAMQGELGKPNELPQQTYDKAFLITVLGEVPQKNQQAALEQLRRTLKPWGELIIAEMISDPHFENRKKVNEMTSNAGFVRSGGWGPWFAYAEKFRPKPGAGDSKKKNREEITNDRALKNQEVMDIPVREKPQKKQSGISAIIFGNRGSESKQLESADEVIPQR